MQNTTKYIAVTKNCSGEIEIYRREIPIESETYTLPELVDKFIADVASGCGRILCVYSEDDVVLRTTI